MILKDQTHGKTVILKAASILSAVWRTQGTVPSSQYDHVGIVHALPFPDYCS